MADASEATSPAMEIALGQIWRPQGKSEQARTVTGLDGYCNLVFYIKENGHPSFASPDRFRKWADRVGAAP